MTKQATKSRTNRRKKFEVPTTVSDHPSKKHATIKNPLKKGEKQNQEVIITVINAAHGPKISPEITASNGRSIFHGGSDLTLTRDPATALRRVRRG